MVVAVQPVGCHVTNFLPAVEGAGVEHRIAVGLVESVDISVLRGLARLDMVEGDALGRRPLRQCVGEELCAVVESNRQRRTATSSFKALAKRAAGRRVSTSMRSPLRLNSPMTFKDLTRHPDHSASAMKSQLLPILGR